MSELESQARFRQASGAEVNEVPDGAVVYLEARERVHYLNPTAYLVFALCDGTRTLSEVIDRVAAEYELEQAPREDVVDCVSSLLAEDLVRPA
jgi:hypothetical protein